MGKKRAQPRATPQQCNYLACEYSTNHNSIDDILSPNTARACRKHAYRLLCFLRRPFPSPVITEKAGRVLDVEKHGGEEPSGRRFLEWVIRHPGWPCSGHLQPVTLTGGYCWPTPKCRNLCAQHAFFEGKKAEEISPGKGTSRTLK